MVYTPNSWVDGPAGNTPITAAQLTHIETQYAQAVAYVGSKAQAINVHDYGAVDDGVTDNTAAFRAAVAAAIAQGRSVIAPGKVYSFTPTGAAGFFFIPLSVGVTLRGAGKAVTTFKIASGASVDWKCFIGSSNTLNGDDMTGLTLSDFTFDYNTQGNPVIDPTHLTSSVRAMVMAPKGDRISIRNIDVLNGDCVWITQLGEGSAGSSTTLRVNDSYVDINVYNFGVNSAYHDTSTVYVFGDRNTVRGSYNGAAVAPAASCAVEVHGSLVDVSIKVDGFASMINATGADFATDSNLSIHDCIGRNLLSGITIWSINSLGATPFGIDGIEIIDNDIELNPALWSAGALGSTQPGLFAHSGIQLADRGAAINLPIANVNILNNNIRYLLTGLAGVTPKVVDSGINISRAAAITSVNRADMNVNIVGNTIISPISAGINIDLSNGMENWHVDNNTVRNPGSLGITGPITAAYVVGVYVATTAAKLLTVDNTRVMDDRSTTIVSAAVNAANLVNSNATSRVQVLDPVVWAATAPPVVVGPSSGGGIYTRYATVGYTAPTGKFTFGSYVTDLLGGVRYMQTASGVGGSTWTVQ